MAVLEKDGSVPSRLRSVCRRVFCAAVATLCITNAVAQEPMKPSVEQITEQANGLISALRNQRDNAMDQLAQTQAQLARLAKELEAAKAAKPEGKP